MARDSTGPVFRFGEFEFSPATGELRRAGRLRRIPPKPRQALALLLEAGGKMVSREQLCEALWNDDTFVEFDDGLNHVIKKLRDVLGDSAENPVFVQTVPGVGYRFIAPLGSGDAPKPTVSVTQVATVALLAVVLVLAAWYGRPRTPDREVIRSVIDLPADQHLAPALNGFLGLAISPDGRQIVYSARSEGRSRFWLRRLDDFDPVELEHTDGASSPVFSPDGRWIAFVADGLIKKLRLSGGAPVPVASVRSLPMARAWGVRLSWGDDGNIVYTSSGRTPLYSVSADGGPSHQITVLAEGETNHDSPAHLPGGRGVVFEIQAARLLGVLDAEGVEHRVPTETRIGAPRYLPSGHLAYIVNWQLHGMAFNLDRLTTEGEPRVLLEDRIFRPPIGGKHYFAVAASGTLVYTPDASRHALVWVDHRGRSTPAAVHRDGFRWPELSSDGRRLAVAVRPGGALWLYDLSRSGRRLIADSSLTSAWTPDGRAVAYWSNGAVWLADADGSRPPRKLKDFQQRVYPQTFHPDGNRLVIGRADPETAFDTSLLELDSGRVTPLMAGPANTLAPRFSPDGRWLAYSSDQEGREEIFVRAFPEMTAPRKVSSGGGRDPEWHADGSRLYYQSGARLFEVSIDTGSGLSVGKPRVVIEGPYLAEDVNNYAVGPDGRFLMVQPDPDRRSWGQTPGKIFTLGSDPKSKNSGCGRIFPLVEIGHWAAPFKNRLALPSPA